VKIAITTSGDSLESPPDQRFGRALNFLLYNEDDDTFVVMNNSQNFNASSGAGAQAAQNIVNAGAEILITGHCGPNAFRVLGEAGVKVYTTDAPTVAEAIRMYRENKLTPMDSADVRGHWA